MLRIKRVYEPCDKNDGFRILVDRLWLRGLTKEKAQIDLWLKGVAPSSGLRKWFAHDPVKWGEFKNRYSQELKNKSNFVKAIKDRLKEGTVTLVYSAKDKKHNNAVVLKEFLER